MYIQHSESDDNTHAFFKHLYPVWDLYSLRRWRTYVMKALQYCPAHLRRAQPVQQREPTLAFLEQSTSVICYHLAICTSPTCGEILWRKPRPSTPMSLAFSRNQPTSCFDTLVLMCRLSSYTRWEWVCDNLPMLKIVSPQVHVQRSLHPLRSSGGGS